MKDWGEKKIKFVFLAACHSSQARDVFLAAGAQHIISINKDKTVYDTTILAFVESFYERLLKPGSTICQAYSVAKRNV